MRLFMIVMALSIVACLSSPASAQTAYYTSNVTCNSGGGYITPNPYPPATINAENEADFFAGPINPGKSNLINCVWSGFPNVTSTAGMMLHLKVAYCVISNSGGCSRQAGIPNCDQNSYARISIWGIGSWNADCTSHLDKVYAISAGTNLASITVTGSLLLDTNQPESAELDIQDLYIQ
jgi:hypothetical protein